MALQSGLLDNFLEGMMLQMVPNQFRGVFKSCACAKDVANVRNPLSKSVHRHKKSCKKRRNCRRMCMSIRSCDCPRANPELATDRFTCHRCKGQSAELTSTIEKLRCNDACVQTDFLGESKARCATPETCCGNHIEKTVSPSYRCCKARKQVTCCPCETLPGTDDRLFRSEPRRVADQYFTSEMFPPPKGEMVVAEANKKRAECSCESWSVLSDLARILNNNVTHITSTCYNSSNYQNHKDNIRKCAGGGGVEKKEAKRLTVCSKSGSTNGTKANDTNKQKAPIKVSLTNCVCTTQDIPSKSRCSPARISPPTWGRNELAYEPLLNGQHQMCCMHTPQKGDICCTDERSKQIEPPLEPFCYDPELDKIHSGQFNDGSCHCLDDHTPTELEWSTRSDDTDSSEEGTSPEHTPSPTTDVTFQTPEPTTEQSPPRKKSTQNLEPGLGFFFGSMRAGRSDWS